MKVQNFSNYIMSVLDGIYPPEELRTMAHILLEEVYGMQRHEIILYPDKNLDMTAVESIVKSLSEGRPIQYVLGHTKFMDMDFIVNENVLIPRPETEELVKWIIAETEGNVKLLDIGTGSGCIAVSLAKMMEKADVWAMDISEGTLEVAKCNAGNNKVDIGFFRADILTCNLPCKYDIIVSNPPYVTESEKVAMRRNVLEYEPQEALFVDDGNPLIYYRRIAELGRISLNENSRLYFEINEKFGNELCELLSELGYVHIELKKDIFDRDRMLRAVWK